MANGTKNSAKTNGNGGAVAEGGEVKATLTSADKQRLFQAYDRAVEDVAKAEAAVEKAVDARTKTVQAIVAACGSKRFNYNGKVMLPMIRTRKSDGKTVGFFRGPGEPSAVEVI